MLEREMTFDLTACRPVPQHAAVQRDRVENLLRPVRVGDHLVDERETVTRSVGGERETVVAAAFPSDGRANIDTWDCEATEDRFGRTNR